MCVMARQVTQHRDDFTPSEIVKPISKQNQNKSSYISTMIILVNTAEMP